MTVSAAISRGIRLITAGAFLSFTLVHVSAQNLDELPLPKWSDEDVAPQQGPGGLGGQLWPEGYQPEIMREGSQNGGIRLFIPKGGQMPPTPKPPEPLPPRELLEVGEDFLKQCEGMPPASLVFDPQHLLHETQGDDLRRLLAYHKGESAVEASFLILGENQKLPDTVNLGRLAGGRIALGNACLVAYTLGEPWRVRLFLSRSITQAVPPEYLRGLIRACVVDSLQASDPVDQLQRFAIQVSIRLIWLERAYPGIATEAVPATVAVVAPTALAPAVTPTVLAEPQLEELPAPAPPPVAQPGLRDWHVWAVSSVWGLIILATLLVGCVLLLSRIRRRRRQMVWILPEKEFQTRLGAPHCGGGGASIHFG